MHNHRNSDRGRRSCGVCVEREDGRAGGSEERDEVGKGRNRSNWTTMRNKGTPMHDAGREEMKLTHLWAHTRCAVLQGSWPHI